MTPSADAALRRVMFRVKVGGRVLSRACTWDEVRSFKEEVKAFCAWDANEKLWVARVGYVLKSAERASEVLRRIFGSEGEAALRDLIARDREARDEFSGEYLLLLPSGDCPLCHRLLKRCSEKVAIKVGGEEVTYYRLDVNAALETVLEWGAEPEFAAEALLELLAQLDPLLTQRQAEALRERAELLRPEPDRVVIRGLGARGSLAVAPKPIDEGTLAALESRFSVDYYRQVRGAEGVELVPTRLRLVRVLSRRALKAPYLLVPALEELLRASGLEVSVAVDWPRAPLPPLESRFSLYSFQEEALEAWVRAGFRGTVVMPTGAGKTFVALAAISRLRVPTLICVTTVELARQWARRVQECLGVRAGVIAGGERRVEPITVATYASAVRALPSIYDKFAFVVFDEGHHLPAETFKEIALHVKARYAMVLSATPERADRNEALIYAVGGPPVYRTSYYELVLRGLLAPLQVEVVPVPLGDEEAAEYERASESPDPNRTAQLIKIASCAKSKLEALRRIVAEERGRVMVFCQFVEQALEAYEAVREVEPRAVLITGETAKGERARAFEAFRRGAVRVLVATTVLDEGVDVPDADVAVILSGTGQVRQMIQRVGRVLRWTPGKVAKVYEVIAAGTIEEALSRSRSIFRAISRGEVESALEVALAAYGRMAEVIERYRAAGPAERERLLEEARALYVRLAREAASSRALPGLSKPEPRTP